MTEQKMSESKHTRNIRYYGGNGVVIVEDDGDLQYAHFADFAYVQESVCAFGGTDIEAVANLALTMRDISKAMQAGFNAAPELLAALEDCCRLINGDTKGYCHVMESSITDGKCWIKENRGCYIWSAIQKARGINNEQG